MALDFTSHLQSSDLAIAHLPCHFHDYARDTTSAGRVEHTAIPQLAGLPAATLHTLIFGVIAQKTLLH